MSMSDPSYLQSTSWRSYRSSVSDAALNVDSQPIIGAGLSSHAALTAKRNESFGGKKQFS